MTTLSLVDSGQRALALYFVVVGAERISWSHRVLASRSQGVA
jgi:hypothetical protein